MNTKALSTLVAGFISLLLTTGGLAEVVRIDITERKFIEKSGLALRYESISGVVSFTLDPKDSANQSVVDIAYAPVNDRGLVEFSADFRLLVPPPSLANGGLLYNVNNRGGSRFPPEIALEHPLSEMGFTYLATGWINEISAQPGRLRLHAPIVKAGTLPIVGNARYEVIVNSPNQEVNIAGAGHLAYRPTDKGLKNATLTRRRYQQDSRVPVERSRFSFAVEEEADSNQPRVLLKLQGGFEPGVIYELIYEAQDPVLAGSGMAGIRDFVALLRKESETSPLLTGLNLSPIEHTIAWGNSQSGRLLRQFVYDGFNTDLDGQKVFDGVIPVISGGGYGMFNIRFAMPTRTNGQHSNHLFPNDLFPFTYGESRDPFTQRTDSILAKSRADGTVPRIMHIQTVNEYWVRAGSLAHTNPMGTADAEIPQEVRFYTIGGSQHGSGNGIPRPPSTGQLQPNPNMWAPFSYSLIAAMYDWVANDAEPPESRYPKIADRSLVPSHEGGRINSQAWRELKGVSHPAAMYQPAFADYGERWQTQRIIDRHPVASEKKYRALVPAVDADNNDLASSTILPPMTRVPLATFVSWNLRALETGSEKALARLSGGYIPFAVNGEVANQTTDPRRSIEELYQSYEDYLNQYEAATDALIEQRYLLPGFKKAIMDIAHANAVVFE